MESNSFKRLSAPVQLSHALRAVTSHEEQSIPQPPSSLPAKR